MFIGVGTQGRAVQRRDCSADGAGLTARVLGGSVLRESGGSHEQEDNGNDCPRNPDPRVAPYGAAGKKAVSGLEKQGWDWINIPAHAKTGKPFFQFIRGSCYRWRRIFSWQAPTTRFRFIAFPTSNAAMREVPSSRRRNPRACN